MSDREQDKAAKRAQWEEINRARAAAKQKEKDAPAQAEAGTSGTSKQFQTVRGTRDLLPPETALWNRVEQTAHEVFTTFGYGEIRPPIFEATELFARGVGGDTDIVSKEMYTFEDQEPNETLWWRNILGKADWRAFGPYWSGSSLVLPIRSFSGRTRW